MDGSDTMIVAAIIALFLTFMVGLAGAAWWTGRK
jgi:hypothetical protein